MASGRQNHRGRFLVVLVPYLWLGFFFLAPFLIVLKISLSHDVIAQPPYAPLLDFSQGWQGLKNFVSQLGFSNYALLASDTI
jgi:putrescine transport system permease protein